MSRCNSQRSPRRLLGTVVTLALLSGCAAPTQITPQQTTLSAPDALAPADVLPDVAPPKCTGQKSSKLYATVKSQGMKSGGGSVCVPAFGGWGGALQYPNMIAAASKVELISSTKAYSPKLFPPSGSQKAIFYIQYAFNGLPEFGTALPRGNPIVSSHLAAKKKYSVQLWEKIGSGLWSSLAECYAVAQKSKYGGSIAGGGATFEGLFYREATGVIEVFNGALVSNKC